MAQVFLSLGSNINPEKNICSCLDELKNRFTVVNSSKVYRTKAVGFEGADFLNSVVAIETDRDIETLRRHLREIELKHHRRRSSNEKFNSRTLDIDLLLYDDVVIETDRYKLPHDDILKYGFVLFPLAEIAPELEHPGLEITIQSITENTSLQRNALQAVSLNCST